MATITEITDEQIAQEVQLGNGDDATKENVEIAEGSSDEDDDDDVPDLEKPEAGEGQPQVQMNKQSRQEKKARKSIAKLGLKPVPGITRVAIRKTKSMLFAINKPEVFKNPTSDTYVVFGEAKVEDTSQQHQYNAAKQFEKAQQEAAQRAAAAATSTAKPELIEEEDEEEVDDGEVDTDGLEEKDIELVIQQANCSKAKAVKALKSNNGDIVNAIMELTM
jgi:nascent polypeptide-associated complex subunit alpha